LKYLRASIASSVGAGDQRRRFEPQVLLRNDGGRSMPRIGDRRFLVDVSGSMRDKLSTKSDLTRMDAAAALGVIKKS
jgi:hypothetical protein